MTSSISRLLISSVRRRSGPLRVAAILPLVVVAVAACGSSGASSPSADPSSGAAGSGGGQYGSGQYGGGPGGRGFPGAFGTIAAASSGSLEVQDASSQTTVTYTASTRFTQTVTGHVAAGECATVQGTLATQSPPAITATSIRVSPASTTGCGFAAGGGQGRRRSGAPTGGVPSGGSRPGPGGNRTNFSMATGTVRSVSGSTVVLQGALRTGRPGASTTPTPTATNTLITVTLGSSTTVTSTQPATSAAAVVGKCAAAIGKADSTGTVAATSITISSPGPNGCQTGFGRPGGFGRGRFGGGNTGGSGSSGND